MKISKLLIATVVTVSALSVSSCTDFLKEEVLDRTNLDNYVKTDEEAVRFLYGGIAAVRDAVFGADFTSVVELPTDDTYFTTNNQPRQALSILAYDNENTYVQSVWGKLYTVISQMNILIAKLEDPGFAGTRANATKILAQARFIRGWAYFQLVQIWGEVPITPAYFSTSGNIRPSRSSIEAVYTQIEGDVKFAFDNMKDNGIKSGKYVMPDTVKTTVAGGLTYYLPISKGAGALLLAKVYAAQKKYTEAEQTVDYLMDKRSLFDLLENYGDLFDVDKKGTANRCKEVLWEMESQAVSGYENKLHREMAPAELTLVNGEPAVGKTTGYHNYVPTEALVMSFDQVRDKRYRWLYQFATKESISSGPAIRKGFDITSTNADLGGPNYVLLRFADALLLKAECCNDRNAPDEAKIYVDEVRERAGLDGLPDGLTKAQMMDAILLERRHEFAHEAGNRLYDLRRTGTYIEAMNAFRTYRASLEGKETLEIINPSYTGDTPKPGDQTSDELTGKVPGDYFQIVVPFVAGSKNVDQKHLYHPIPNWDVKENPNLNNGLHTPNWN